MVPTQRSTFFHTLLLCLLAIVLASLAAYHPHPASTAVPHADESLQLDVGSSIRRQLAPNEKQQFKISLNQDLLLRLFVAKGDLGLWVTVVDPNGLKSLEQVSRDLDDLDLSFRSSSPGIYTIEVQSVEHVGLPGEYELHIQSVIEPTARDLKANEARQAFARAEVLRTNWNEGALRTAANEYDHAASLSMPISDFMHASQAKLKSGDVYFLLSQYRQSLDRYQQATFFAEKTTDWLAKARSLSHLGRLYSYLGKNDSAQRNLTYALELFKDHDNNQKDVITNYYAEALTDLAEVSYAKGDFLSASKQLESALKILRNDRRTESKIHLFIGYIAGSTGNRERGVAEISQALNLFREVDDKAGEGLSLTALGLSHSLSGDQNRAIEFHRNALDIFRSIGDRHSEAVTFNALGQAYENMNDYAISFANYEKALQLFHSSGSLDGASFTTCNLARALHLEGKTDESLTYYNRCLQLSRVAGKRRTEAYALDEIAKVYISQNRNELALKQYQHIGKFYDRIGDHRGQAKALDAYGDLVFQLGKKQEALDVYRRALPLSKDSDDKNILTNTLYNLARVNLELGDPYAALSFEQQAIKILEDLRTSIASPDLRASYFSGVRRHYELCIRILMELESLRPGHGYSAQALALSERARMRVLFDLVTESRVNDHQAASEKLVEEERRLRGLFRSQAEYHLNLSLNGKNPAEISEVDVQMAQLRAEYDEVQASLKEQNPQLSSLEHPPDVSLEQIQNQLRGSDTMLLEYGLGDEKSYLWAVTADSFQSFNLLGRKTLEDAAGKFYELSTARQRLHPQDADYHATLGLADKELEENAGYLSKLLLGPLASELGSRRLIVVSEGVLQYIPFDALPVPQTDGRISSDKTFVIEKNEVVVLPSVSTLIAIRNRPTHSRSPDKLVAVISDPVFSKSDERVQKGISTVALAQNDGTRERSSTSIDEARLRDGSLVRLRYAKVEADAISSLAPWGTIMVVEGFDATRERAMSSDIGQYQIVHFATHGFLDSQHPGLSGIVLTMVDQNGMRRDGMMPLNDIYSLDLSSELTVLSACQTALGKDIKGEGLVGLTHSFLSAGSKSVVSSLWKVDDKATAALMADFYQSMLETGAPPATALRSAKLKMMRDKHWSAPYYWAGFILEGEYANHIAVDRRPWLRTMLILFPIALMTTAIVLFAAKRRQQSFSSR